MNHIIWSNNNLDYEDWREDLEFEYPELSEDERLRMMYELNDEYLNDERMNLNIQLSQPILCIADLGLWDGRRSAYREIESGNIRDCLHFYHDYATFFVDQRGDLRCDDIHHDGTNHYLYRVFRDGVSETRRNRLEEKIVNGTVTKKDLEYCTRKLGPDICMVYGWDYVGSSSLMA